ncbi:phosphomannomutase / phosphoglucomutase [Luteibacter sp. UNC138MFCol5.1]|uniref:phosphomannomutase/phosphoglucomutase n=1 Tax=Luteibacter sp. UNC138MFCol5.1 TaxID=1502774 RepID=UPI0008AE0BB7|nr:phosphomannomutase/phosphoglucomutase [Luteibacter sp. UNC138MFCol5.1]SEO30767.1 phosphomannomutase / phosphoglucomutase [Luteibacter sp. UNC138MFCol5.1]
MSRVDLRRLLPLAGATLLLVAGVFCAWQTWLIADEGSAAERTHAAQRDTTRELGALIAGKREALQRALVAGGIATSIDDHAAAAERLRAALPSVRVVEVYSGGLDEVVRANYREFGYAKAAQLMAALGGSGPPRASTSLKDGERRLSMVEPVAGEGTVRAWIWLEYPFDDIAARFDAASPGGGRLELRQGEGRESLRLLDVGSRSAELEAEGQRVEGTSLFVFAAMPKAFIVIPHSEALGALLSLVGLGGGALLLWGLRRRPAVEPEAMPEPDVMVADIVRKPRLPPTPTPAAVVAPTPVAAPPAGEPSLDPAIFRAYDIRGVVGKTLTADIAHRIGQAIGARMLDADLREIVVGRDGRLSGAELAHALSDGLRAAGIDVIDLGMVPTPVVYFAAYHFGTGCAVSVTGSHNPADHNGFKIVIGGETLSEDAIADLHRRIVAGNLPSDGVGTWREQSATEAYVARIAGDVAAERRLKVVVDAGNGVAGAVAPRVLEDIGCEVIPLYCDVDGQFPNHHPDPSDPRNLADLIAAVHTIGADLGIAFDGDGDRLGVVTQAGEIVWPDRLLMLFAQDVLARNPGATIIYDVKCTGHLRGVIQQSAGVPLMWRTGHSLMKAKLRETGAALAGEMSGHFFFADNNRWYGFDDGIYAAARLLEIVAGDVEERSVAELFDTLPKSVSTPELRLPMEEGAHFRFMDAFRASATFDDARITTIDGVRVDWADGFGLVRASNTSPALIFRFDADSARSLERIKQSFRQRVLAVDKSLALPF